MARCCVVLAALLGASGVMMGAWHAHGLEKMLKSKNLNAQQIQQRMDFCETAVVYQMYHALALVAVALLMARRLCIPLLLSAVFFLAGVAGFSGGLYVHLWTDKIHWAVVPSGGMMLILGWLSLAVGGALALKKECKSIPDVGPRV